MEAASFTERRSDMESVRERLLLALTEADMKASEAGIGVSPMSRARLEYIVDRLLEVGVLLPPRDDRTDGVCSCRSGRRERGLCV